MDVRAARGGTECGGDCAGVERAGRAVSVGCQSCVESASVGGGVVGAGGDRDSGEFVVHRSTGVEPARWIEYAWWCGGVDGAVEVGCVAYLVCMRHRWRARYLQRCRGCGWRGRGRAHAIACIGRFGAVRSMWPPVGFAHGEEGAGVSVPSWPGQQANDRARCLTDGRAWRVACELLSSDTLVLAGLATGY